MADLGIGSRTDLDVLEDEVLEWALSWDRADDAIYAAARALYIKVARVKREIEALRKRIATGGRARKRNQRSNVEHHKRLIDDFFGTPCFTAVVLSSIVLLSHVRS